MIVPIGMPDSKRTPSTIPATLPQGLCSFTAFPITRFKTHRPAATSMLVAAGLCVLYLVIGKAVKEHKPWGRVAGIVLGVLLLSGIPIGTIIGAYLLWCLIGKW